jgi:uncharacterized membrane protein YdjX (TVP38/TMEM64 family)
VNSRKIARIAFLTVIAAMIVAGFFSPLRDSLTPERLAESRDALLAMIEARPLVWAGAFFLLSVAASSLCFPAAPIVGISAGALFGFWPGLALMSLSFTIGSTVACLASRHLLRDGAQTKLGPRLEALDRGFERHGPAYLLALRFNPFIPYWLVNLAMGIIGIRLAAYVPLTWVGLLPALTIYAFAGSRLATAESLTDIVSTEVVLALLLLSLVPLVADRLLARPTPG